MKHVLIAGCGSGVGFAMLEYFLLQSDVDKVIACYRSPNDNINKIINEYSNKIIFYQGDLSNEQDHIKLKDVLLKSNIAHIDLCISSMGILQNKFIKAERSLSEVNMQTLIENYKCNAMSHILLMKSIEALWLKSDKPIFLALSAKVGSISDNALGGWYSYRMSKAALNMAIKTLSIEMKRKHPNSLCLAMHPGTVDTKLSKPFIKNAAKKYTIHSAEQAASNIRNVLSQRNSEDSGSFYNWTGEELPW